MKLPVLSPKVSLKGKKIFLRVDWNIPLHGHAAAEDSLKVSRSIQTVKALKKRGAIVIIATHLGRPKGRDMALTTRKLMHLVAIHHGLEMEFVGDDLETAQGVKMAQGKIAKAKPGAVFLLENVRFHSGEQSNGSAISKAYASLADMYVNDAFADCHRKDASVVGVAKLLPHYAGPDLVAEVDALSTLLAKPKRPYVAIIGGAKLTTKFPVLSALLKTADKVCIGGAMANAFFAAKKLKIGKSYVEKEGITLAKKLLTNKKIILPLDVVVASSAAGTRARAADPKTLKPGDFIGDIGPATMRAWAAEIKRAKTVVWNGPLGITDVSGFKHGSMVVARAIASRSKGSAFGVVGGGDTLPVVLATGMSEWYDHLSTGGGAMLEFIALRGKLPGLTALATKK